MSDHSQTKGGRRSRSRVVVSTTEGRAHFPDIVQSSLAEKSVIGFHRYGRIVGAMTPIEAVRMLAGFESFVDEDVQRRVRRAARALLEQTESERELLGLGAFDESDGEPPVRPPELLSEHPPKAPRRKGSKVEN